MESTVDASQRRRIHPLHAILLAGTIPLFLAAMVSDIAYTSSFQVQWSNFASWLIAGGLVFGGLALVWAIVDLFRQWRGRPLLYALLLLVLWIVGFVNALIHAKDAWAAMPTGLILSVILVALACGATWVGFSSLFAGGER